MSLRLPDLDTHHSLSSDTPLPPLPFVSHAETNTFIDAFKTQVHVVFSFVSPERISQLAKRYQELPGSLGDDQLALLYAVFAMGSYRLQTYVGQRLDPSAPRPDVAYFRHALEKLGTAATVTALNALICLTLYAMSTSSVASSRSLIGKMVYVAQELGLHRKVSAEFESLLAIAPLTFLRTCQYTALAYPTETGARPLLFYTILIDTYHAGLVGERPLLHSFDTSLLLDAESTPSNEGTASPVITHLVLLQHAYLMEAYSGSKDPRAPLTVLNAEAKLIQFRGQLGDASSMASSLATTQ